MSDENEESLGLGESHSRGGNAIKRCDILVDGYPDGLAHGLQKDAIQNALDARAGKKPAIVEFEIIENKIGRFLTITDKNTEGLKGKARNELGANVEDDDADWLRFEGSHDTKTGPNAIGARGQGKFVMLGSSSEYKMFYDTKRADGIYRLGATQATKNDFPIWPKDKAWENEIAASKLLENCGLQPLQENGTRLIIFNPKEEEVLEAIKNGNLKQAIQETWFRAIEKKQLEVYIIVNGQPECIDNPNITIDTSTQSAESWVLDKDFNDNIIIASIKDGTSYSQKKYKIKKFEAYYDPNRALDEPWQGIAIIHNGMKICVPRGNPLPKEMRETLTGFIEFDEKLDKELRAGHNQHPNHYDLMWRQAIPQAIKNYINEQLEDFGKEKLGLSQNSEEKKKRAQIEAEDWAMDMLKKHAPDLNLFGAKRRGHGNSKSTPIDIPPPIDKDIGVTFKGFTFPDDSRKPRVNWEEKLSFNLSVFNKTDNKVTGKVSIRILKDDTEIDVIINNNIEVDPKNLDYRIKNEPFILDINENQFSKKGKYRILARLFDENGSELHKLSKPFWVEDDPQQNNEPFDQVPWNSESKQAWKTDGALGVNPRLLYNINHPEFKSAENNNNKPEYMLKLCLEGAIHFILSATTDNYDADNLYAPLDTDTIKTRDPARIHEEAMKYIAQIRWNIYQGGDV